LKISSKTYPILNGVYKSVLKKCEEECVTSIILQIKLIFFLIYHIQTSSI